MGIREMTPFLSYGEVYLPLGFFLLLYGGSIAKLGKPYQKLMDA